MGRGVGKIGKRDGGWRNGEVFVFIHDYTCGLQPSPAARAAGRLVRVGQAALEFSSRAELVLLALEVGGWR